MTDAKERITFSLMSKTNFKTLRDYPCIVDAAFQSTVEAARTMIETATRSAEDAGDAQVREDLLPLLSLSDSELSATLGEVRRRERAGAVLVVWGAGPSSVDAIRTSDSDLAYETPNARAWRESCGRDDYWCVVLPIDTDTSELDRDPSVAGYQSFETGC